MITGGKKDVFLAGSYTVEAAFLVPIIIGIFFAWLFQLFYLHDRVVINGMLQEAVIEREELIYSSAKENDSEGDGQKKKEIQSHLWLLRIRAFHWKAGGMGGKYTLRSEAEWDIPVMKKFLKSHVVYGVSVETGKLRPEKYVRFKGREE